MNIEPGSFFHKYILWGSRPNSICSVIGTMLQTSIAYFLLLSIPFAVYYVHWHLGVSMSDIINSYGEKSLFEVTQVTDNLFGKFVVVIYTFGAVIATLALGIIISIALMVMIITAQDYITDAKLTKAIYAGTIDRIKKKTCNLVTYHKDDSHND